MKVRFNKKTAIVMGIVAMMLALAVPAMACTSIVVGKLASADGSVMTTHTCDGTYEFRLNIVPAKDWPAGSMRPVFKGGGTGAHVQDRKQVGEIPQVAHTFMYYDTAYPFANEKGVMMGETTVGGRRELRNPEGMFEIWELQRIALERASTAREAIKIMGEMAEKYGYGDGGECLTVIDKDEAWFFEIYGAGPLEKGAIWVAQRVPDDEVGVSANRSRIFVIKENDPDNFMYSKNVFTYAKDLGWWDPAKGPLHFANVYAPKLSVYNSRREWRVLSLIAPSLKLDPWLMEYPFSVKPDKKVTVQDLMKYKRDHYEGTEFDLTKGLAAGPFGNPNRYATPATLGEWERAISIFRCSYSVILQARSWLPTPIANVIWFGEDAPHSTCYVPFYVGATSIPASFTVGSRATLDRNSAWWAFNLVSNFADLKYSYMIKDIEALASKFEDEALAMQPVIESAAAELYKVDPKLAVSFLTNYSNAHAEKVVAEWWKLFDTLAVKYQDGYVSLKTAGYPDEWLKAVGFNKLPAPSK
ncbi:MAG TPA: C69 family dipeptidase [Bacillota bacterium]|nr:C69 family dipeptidase [Bacillota bacterium]HOG52864.1 C69 family dipeptidase [Bacillota bacterium]